MKTIKRNLLTLVALLTLTAGAWAQNNDCAEVSPNTGKTMDMPKRQAPRRAVASFGDLEKSFDCSSGYQYGVCTDGENIYTTSWSLSITDGYVFHEYDSDGNLIGAFNISGVNAGIRDITYDGTYFYGSTCSNTVYQLDLANRALVGTLTIPLNVRAITYDPTNDGFWAIDGWNATLQLYDRNGNFIKNGKTPGGISGCAYYEDTDGEEHVLQFNNSDNNVYDYNITNDELSDGVFNFNTLPGADGYSGGCFIAEYDGQMCFFGGMQQSPSLIGIYPLPDAVGADTAGFDLTVGTNEHGTITFTVGGNENATTASEGDKVTVTVTPATGYATKEVTAVAYAVSGEAQSPQRAAGIDILKDIDVTGSANTWTFKMPAAHALVSATYTRVIQNSWIQPENIDDQTYTGEGLEPAITVKDGETVLTEDVDYTVTYSNNVQGGSQGVVTITGIGNYSGTVSKTFNVVAAVYSTANAAIDVNVPEGLGQLTTETIGQTTDLYYFLQSYLQNSPNPAYIKLRLEAGAQYVISKPLTVLSAITIEGDAEAPATIDATALGANPFVKIDNNYTSGVVNAKGFCTNIYDVTFKNFLLKGLKGQVFYANKQKYLIPYLNVDNCIFRMEGASGKTFFDFNGGGFVEQFTLTNSTLSGDATTSWSNGGFFSTQGGPNMADTGASGLKLIIKNNTFYNVAKGKTVSTLRQNSQTWMSFEVMHNVIVNSGKKGEFVKGLNAGQNRATPSWLVQYNSFTFDGADVGASEISGASNIPIAANVEGEIVFANGDDGIAEGDFSLDACPQKEAKIGDPRWLSASLLSKRITTESLDDDKDLAKAINQGVKDGFSRFTLEANARYQVKQSIVTDKDLVITGNNVKIDVEHADAFIVLDGTTELAKKADGTDSDHKLIATVKISGLTIQGLQSALLKDNQKTLAEEVEIDNCVIEMPASNKNVLDFDGKGYAGKAVVKNSTIWANGKNTGFFAQYGSRPKNVNGDLLQEFDVQNSTIVNIANGKNFCDLKQNGTAQNVYIIKNNIFNNCGKSGQTVVGFNKGQASATPAWDVKGNSFLVDGEDNNAAEISKAGQKGGEDIVKNCVAGAPGFKNAAEGDFTLSAYSAQCAEKTGDPRWYAEGGHYNPVTAIDTVKTAEKADDGAWYTIQGIRTDKPAKGLYIHDGKKVIVK